jgi:opacity protein-like surface antigen
MQYPGTMKRFVLGSVALIAIGVSIKVPAQAADMAVKALPPPAYTAPYNWSGLYLGASIGGAFSSGSANVGGATWDPGATEFIGGFQAGYNWQFGNFLVGVEGNFDWAVFGRPNIPLRTPLGAVQASATQNWISTLAGRFGITSDKWLYYGKVGGGWAEDRASLNPNGTSWTGSSTVGGWVAGGGLEYAFKPNWTVKLEYDYFDCQSRRPVEVRLQAQHDVANLNLGPNRSTEQSTGNAIRQMIKAVGDEIKGVLATPRAAAVHANVDSCPAVSGHRRHYWCGSVDRCGG